MTKSKKQDFKLILFSSFFGGLSMYLLITFFQFTLPNMLIFSSMGSSTALLCLQPKSQAARLRTFLTAYMIEVCIGLIFISLWLVDLLPIAMVGGMVIFFSILGQNLMEAVHIPSIGVGLSFVLGEKNYESFSHLLITVVTLLVLTKVLYYIFHPELYWKNFHKHEIRNRNSE